MLPRAPEGNQGKTSLRTSSIRGELSQKPSKQSSRWKQEDENIAIDAIEASVDFLLEALAEDLNAPIPSKEPAFLHVANDRVCLVRSLVERLESARIFLATTETHFGSQDGLSHEQNI